MARREPVPFLALVAFFGLFLAPIIVLLLVPIGALPITFEPALLTSSNTRQVLWVTLYVATLSSLIRTPVMFAFGWLVARTNLPGRRFFDSIGLFGLTVPDLLKAVGWLVLLNPVNGLLTMVLVRSLHVGPFDVYSPTGLALVCAWVGFPLEYLAASAAIKNLDPAVEEASRVAGHSIWRTFLSVSLPSLLQALLIVFSLGFLITFTDFDVAIVFTSLGHYQVLGTEMYLLVAEPPVNYGAAATFGLLFLAASMVLFAIYLVLTRRTFMFQTVRGASPRGTLHELAGARKWLAVGFCTFVIVVSYVLPLVAMVWLSFTVPGRLFTWDGLANYVGPYGLFAIVGFLQAWESSIVLGVLAVVVVVPFALVLSYGIFRSRVAGARLLEYIVILPRGIPGLVYGFGVLLLVLFTPGLRGLYGTFAPFLLAVVMVSTPLAILILGANMVQIGDDIEEASRVSGWGWLRTFAWVVIPLTFRALLNSIQYTFIATFSNLSSVIFILLATPTFALLLPLMLETLGNNGAAINAVAAGGVLITAFLGLVILGAKIAEA